MEKYKNLKKIGEGTFGHIYTANNCETNEPVSLKEICHGEDEGVPSSVIREIGFLRDMEHSNIIRLLDVVNDEKASYLVFEYMDLDLKKYIDTSPDIARDPYMIKWFLQQILCGLTYCHSHNILHRDLRPQHLLIDSRTRILKLAGFGSAKALGIPLKSFTRGQEEAILWYTAPEIMLGAQNYSTPVDVWSAGCIFAEMVIQRPLFACDNTLLQVNKIFSIVGSPNEETWPGVTSFCDYLDSFDKCEPKDLAEVVPSLEPVGVDLLSKMLCMNPRRRITSWEAMEHAYFKDVQKP